MFLFDQFLYGVMAALVMSVFYQRWLANRHDHADEEGYLVLQWAQALVLAAVLSQLIYEIPFSREAGIDRGFLFARFWPEGAPWAENLFILGLGALVYLSCRLGLVLLPYRLIIGLLNPPASQGKLRGGLFLVLYYASEALLGWPEAAPYLGFLSSTSLTDLARMALFWLEGPRGLPMALGISLLAAVIFDLRYRPAQRGNEASLAAWLPAGLLTFVAYQFSRDGWLALLTGSISLTWIGQRLRHALQFPNGARRLLFWALFDLPALAAAAAAWVFWQVGWISLLVYFVVMVLGFVFLPQLLMALLPITAREEWLYVLTQSNQRELAAPIAHELEQRRLEVRRRKALRALGGLQRQLAQASRERQAGHLDRALEMADGVVAAFQGLGGLIEEQKQTLGQAHQECALVQAARGDLPAALKETEAARRYITPNLELIELLAVLATDKGAGDQAAMAACIEYLRRTQGHSVSQAGKRVLAYLEGRCRIDETSLRPIVAEARQIAEQVLNADSNQAWAHRVLGQAQLLQGQPQEARASLESANRLVPADPLVQGWLGDALAAEGQAGKARDMYEAALKGDPRQPRVLLHLATLLLIAPADLTRALALLQQAEALVPNHPRLFHIRGQALHLAGDRPAAIHAFQRALALDASQQDTHALLADCLFEQEDFSGANEHYTLLSELTPPQTVRQAACLVELDLPVQAVPLVAGHETENPAAAVVLARAQLRLGDDASARKILEHAEKNFPDDPSVCYFLGCTLAWQFAAGDVSAHRAAERHFDKLADASGDFADRARLQMGHLCLWRDRVEEALRWYRSISLEASPGLARQTHLALARAFLALDQPDQAHKALESLDKPGAKLPQAHLLRGMAAELQGDLPAAVQSYEKARAFGPLGVARFLQGQEEAACASLEQARAAHDESDRTLYTSGLLAGQSGDTQTALADWGLLARRHPEDNALAHALVQLRDLHGQALYKRGEYREAVACFEQVLVALPGEISAQKNLQAACLQAAAQEASLEQAESYLERARILGAPRDTIDSVLAAARLRAKDYPGARKLLASLADRPDAAYNLALLDAHEGREKHALTQLKHVLDLNPPQDLRERALWARMSLHGQDGNWAKVAQTLDELAL